MPSQFDNPVYGYLWVTLILLALLGIGSWAAHREDERRDRLALAPDPAPHDGDEVSCGDTAGDDDEADAWALLVVEAPAAARHLERYHPVSQQQARAMLAADGAPVTHAYTWTKLD
jgi:dolichyl-phosphate-mannose--protein O-mannosyl transferase